MRLLTILLFLATASLKLTAQNDFALKLSDSALALTKDKVKYNPKYFVIAYPNGDVSSPVKHKLGQPWAVDGHKDHIHFSVNGN